MSADLASQGVQIRSTSIVIAEEWTYEPTFLVSDDGPVLFGHHKMLYVTVGGNEIERTKRWCVAFSDEETMVAEIKRLEMTEEAREATDER